MQSCTASHQRSTVCACTPPHPTPPPHPKPPSWPLLPTSLSPPRTPHLWPHPPPASSVSQQMRMCGGGSSMMMMGTGGCQGGGQGSVQCSTGGFSAVSSPLASNTVPYGCCEPIPPHIPCPNAEQPICPNMGQWLHVSLLPCTTRMPPSPSSPHARRARAHNAHITHTAHTHARMHACLHSHHFRSHLFRCEPAWPVQRS